MSLEKDLDSMFGEKTFRPTSSIALDTGYPPLNEVLTGDYYAGIPCGKMIEIYGPSSSGKTLIATMLMIAAQKAGGVAFFADYERSFSAEFAAKLGLNLESPHFIHYFPDTWEDGNTAAMKFANAIRASGRFDGKPIVVIQDSIAAAVPQSVYGKELDEFTMNDTTALSRVTSTTLKVVKGFAEKLDMLVVYLNQIRTKPGVVHGDPTTTPGGVATEFYCDARLSLGKQMKKDKSTGEMISQTVPAFTKKNKMSRPFRKTEFQLKFVEGGTEFDFAAGLLEELTKIGVLETSGSWITWTDGKKYQKGVLLKKIEAEDLVEDLKQLFPRKS